MGGGTFMIHHESGPSQNLTVFYGRGQHSPVKWWGGGVTFMVRRNQLGQSWSGHSKLLEPLSYMWGFKATTFQKRFVPG